MQEPNFSRGCPLTGNSAARMTSQLFDETGKCDCNNLTSRQTQVAHILVKQSALSFDIAVSIVAEVRERIEDRYIRQPGDAPGDRLIIRRAFALDLRQRALALIRSPAR